MSRSTTRHATPRNTTTTTPTLSTVCRSVCTAVCRRSKSFLSLTSPSPDRVQGHPSRPFSTIDRYAGASTSTTPHHARPFTPSDLTSPPRRYPLSPPTSSSTDPRIGRSSRCRYSPRLSQAGLWSDVHSLPYCVCICICICIHPSALLRASAKPPPLAQSQSP